MEGPGVTTKRQSWKGEGKRSGLERQIDLLLKLHKLKAAYEKDFLIYVTPSVRRFYTPDWSLPNSVFLESKGRWSTEDRKKMLLVIHQHSDKKFLMIFQRNNKIRKGSKTTYGTWCDKNGIKWCLLKDFEKDPKKIITKLETT